MSTNKILQQIDQIAATASKNEKQALVKQFCENPLFLQVCEYSYNPFKTYGLRQIPDRRVTELGGSDSEFDEFDEGTWGILNDLISRNLTGNNARDAVRGEISRLAKDSADLFVRIIRKDLKAGFSESTINKAVKDAIPEFPYCRCSLPKNTDLTKWPWALGVPSQEKADGMFANVDHEETGLVSIRSRQGTEFPIEKFPGIVADIQNRTARGVQNHGEFVVMRDGNVLPREIGNGIMNHVISGGDFTEGDAPLYLIWDQIPLSSVVKKGTCKTRYRQRLAGIIQQLRKVEGVSVRLIPTRLVFSLKEAYAHAASLMKLGKEGTVIKHPDMPWIDGTSKFQIKIKLEFVVELEITGIVPGKDGGKNEGRAGSFATKSSDDLLRVDVTVKNEKLRDRVDANPDNFVGGIISVVANDILLPSQSNDLHSLFLPRMADENLRTDKSTADSLEQIFAQKEAAIFGKKLMEAA